MHICVECGLLAAEWGNESPKLYVCPKHALVILRRRLAELDHLHRCVEAEQQRRKGAT